MMNHVESCPQANAELKTLEAGFHRLSPKVVVESFRRSRLRSLLCSITKVNILDLESFPQNTQLGRDNREEC